MRATRPDESTFDELAARSGEDLISIFIPTHRAGREVAQDRIYLKNQLSDVDGALADLGWRPRERSQRLSGAMDLLDDAEFWEHQDAGLAVFIADDDTPTTVSSSRSLEASSFVMPVFMLRPLVADIQPLNAPVLALSRDEVSLYRATEASAEQMDVDLPSYEDVNWFVDRETQRQQHPDQAGTARNRHGHEASARDDEDFARFLREVDAAIREFASETPLIVLGDDDLVARFSNLSTRETVSPANSGMKAPFTETQVREMVTDTIGDMARARLEDALAAAADQLGLGNAANSIDDSLPAAYSGRVDRLVVHRSAQPVWGRFNETSMEVDAHEEKRPGDVDLLDRLVVWSRANGASIVATETPVDDGAFIATFRY